MSEDVQEFACQGSWCDATVALFQERCEECGRSQTWDQQAEFECPNCSQYVLTRAEDCQCGATPSLWSTVIKRVCSLPPRTDLAVAKEPVMPPTDWEFETSGGKPDGQQANYRLPLEERDEGIHVKEYDDVYHVHYDEVDPSNGLLRHFLTDAPQETMAAVGLLALAYIHTRQ